MRRVVRGSGRRSIAFAAALVVVAPQVAATDVPPPVRGLDHVVVAVTDLDAAAEQYRRLGFTLKPGRPHDNGIRNRHVKFEDGTEIELLTVGEAQDALTREYRAHLANGDGPKFVALWAPSWRPRACTCPMRRT